jgi:hypothetical protein
MEFVDNGETYNTLPVSKRTSYIVLKSQKPYYIHKTSRKQPTEEESSSFRNVWCIQCGVCDFKRMEKVLLLSSKVLQDNEMLCFRSYQYYTLHIIRTQH